MTDLKDTHWYIAGPMSGVPQYNIPLFDFTRDLLTHRGYTITSPADLDSQEVRELGLANETGWYNVDEKGNHRIGEGETAESWGDFLARDVKLIADSDIFGIILLPNWEKSRGARLEAFVGLLQGEKFRYATFNPETTELREVPQAYIKRLVAR